MGDDLGTRGSARQSCNPGPTPLLSTALWVRKAGARPKVIWQNPLEAAGSFLRREGSAEAPQRGLISALGKPRTAIRGFFLPWGPLTTRYSTTITRARA